MKLLPTALSGFRIFRDEIFSWNIVYFNIFRCICKEILSASYIYHHTLRTSGTTNVPILIFTHYDIWLPGNKIQGTFLCIRNHGWWNQHKNIPCIFILVGDNRHNELNIQLISLAVHNKHLLRVFWSNAYPVIPVVQV